LGSRSHRRSGARAPRFRFGTLDLHRVYVDVDARNRSSLRVAEKLGMRREAHFVENAWVKGEWTDSVIYALLAREWARETRGVHR
jgi:RimJ/RimL family protein N-acetyltransferase